MRLIDRYTRADYASLEDFYANYDYTVPENFNYAYDVIDEFARLSPNQRAMIWTNDAGDEKILSFGDISRLSNKAANALMGLGIGKGDPVILLLKRRWEYWVTALALMKIGAIQIPATAQLQKKDISYRISASGAKLVVCVGEDEVCSHVAPAAVECGVPAACLGEDREGFINYSRLLDEASEELSIERVSKNNDIMLMYFTSGTTGMPKMVVHSYTYPLGHLATGRFWHNLDEHSIHITTADSGWAKCAWGKFYGQWMCGATHFIYDFDRFNAKNLLAMLEKYRVTSFCAPPTIYRYLIKEDMSAYDLSALEWGTSAGEPLNPEVFNRFKEFTGVELREGFGQTENSPLVFTPKWMTPKPGSIGMPSPHYNIRLLNADGNDVEAGEEGEICVDLSVRRPAGLFVGYYQDEERTAEAFANGIYRTGDMAWRDEDGYYWFIGRADDVIKSSGYRIGPFEIESALISHPAVIECAITGVPDPERGQVVKATVVLANGYEPSDALRKELQNHVKKVTAPYKYPRILEFVKELPKTVSGKIQRAKLRKEDEKK